LELKVAKDEVIYRVGRNVLLFQQMEHILKYLVANGSISGYSSELLSRHEKHKDSVSKRTLGMVVGDFLDNAEPAATPDELREPHFAFTYSPEITIETRAEVESLVLERNKLIHHFLVGVDAESVDSYREAARLLEHQKHRLTNVISDLLGYANGLRDMRKELAEFLMSDEFEKLF